MQVGFVAFINFKIIVLDLKRLLHGILVVYRCIQVLVNDKIIKKLLNCTSKVSRPWVKLVNQ